MRLAMLLIAAMIAVPSLAQNPNHTEGEVAWEQCKLARKNAHTSPVANPDPAPAIRAVAQAAAALSRVPERYKRYWQFELDMIRGDLTAASKLQGRGEGKRKIADGQYAVIERRVNAGNWVGVAAEARKCAAMYYDALRDLSAADYGYGYAKDRAEELKREIEQFLAMLDDFEDFYGPMP